MIAPPRPTKRQYFSLYINALPNLPTFYLKRIQGKRGA
jgi:hypothetical protein